MRLIAIQIPPAITGGQPAYLELGTVTVLLGANDSGKSRILRSLALALDTAYVQPSPAAERPTVYVELEQPVVRWLDEALDDSARRAVPYLPERRLFGRPLTDDLGRRFQAAGEAQAAGGDALQTELRILRTGAGLEDPTWDHLFAELAKSRLAAIRPLQDGWQLDWCMPPPRQLGGDVRDALRRLGVSAEDEDTPVAAVPLLPWAVGRRGMPRIMTLPQEYDPHSDWDDGVEAHIPPGPDAIGEPQWQNLLRETFRRLVLQRLAPFVRERYDLTVDADGTPWFVRRQGGTRVRPTDMADGFRLWIDLAMLDAHQVLSLVASRLTAISEERAAWPQTDAATRLRAHVTRAPGGLDDFLRDEPDLASELVADASSDLGVDQLARGAHSYVGGISDEPLTLAAGTGERVPTLFLIDEPERHLHPGLAREAAAWIQRVADNDLLDGQLLMATHSVQLMGLSRGVRYAQVRRPGSETIVVSVGDGHLGALDIASAELGLDRGELLTLKRVFCFVEGAVDKLVLDELFGRRLRDSGVELIPMHGTKKMAAIIESGFLFEHYRQRVAVIVDNITREALPGAKDLAAMEAILSRSSGVTDELRKTTELLKNAWHAGRNIAVNAIPRPDIIAELDAGVLCELQETTYPGFEASAVAANAADAKSWKRFCVSQGWIKDGPDDVLPVVVEMRRRGLQPPDLVRLVEWLQDLAAGVGPT